MYFMNATAYRLCPSGQHLLLRVPYPPTEIKLLPLYHFQTKQCNI